MFTGTQRTWSFFRTHRELPMLKEAICLPSSRATTMGCCSVAWADASRAVISRLFRSLVVVIFASSQKARTANPKTTLCGSEAYEEAYEITYSEEYQKAIEALSV